MGQRLVPALQTIASLVIGMLLGAATLSVFQDEGPRGHTGAQGEPGEPGCTPALMFDDTILLVDTDCDGEIDLEQELQGPRGSRGARGATGQAGAEGLPGDDGRACWDINGNEDFDVATEDTDGDGVPSALDCQGLSGAPISFYAVSTANSTLTSYGVELYTYCDPGDVVVSGGWQPPNWNRTRAIFVLYNNKQLSNDGREGWFVYALIADQTYDDPLELDIYAICADMP